MFNWPFYSICRRSSLWLWYKEAGSPNVPCFPEASSVLHFWGPCLNRPGSPTVDGILLVNWPLPVRVKVMTLTTLTMLMWQRPQSKRSPSLVGGRRRHVLLLVEWWWIAGSLEPWHWTGFVSQRADPHQSKNSRELTSLRMSQVFNLLCIGCASFTETY